MSDPVGYMMLAVRNRIRSAVVTQISSSESTNVAACELTDNGRPTHPYNGMVFYAVHGGRRRSNNTRSGEYYLDEYYDFDVTVSVKSAHIARYRFGDVAITKSSSGLTFLADLAVVALTGYLSLSEEASTLMLDDFPNDQPFMFGEPPVFLGGSQPVDRYPDWFGATASVDKPKPMGISQELRFQGLRHIRLIGQN